MKPVDAASNPARRALLAAGAGTAVAAALVHGAAPARADVRPRGTVVARLRQLEREHGARVGAFAYNVATGAGVRHRSDERFPICSVFKTLAAAAVLRDLDRNGETLAKRIRYTEADLVDHSPVTGTPEHLEHGMTIAELCDATIVTSDNTAGNLLLRELGGPNAVTRFCRSIGDTTTRLDRWETDLSSGEPWRVEDTTSPGAIAGSCARLVLGNVLEPGDRRLLTGWMLNCATSGKRFRAGLPADWTVADKTGGGGYGTGNDVGIAWTPDGAPIVLAVLTTKPEAGAAADDALIAKTAGVLADAVG
ncbi:class A beta-lactamase [Streptomyces meridianus]|uniref:Beta-lactamase n=1 Tax=Streptomyces meridianus TaxID=2938945 RepID=A0ABT0X8V8_9ACTN|nr:class A beta-lactamase [Streptomyces meridianus]MCM2578730.1 class A beta-lactamase [Streptomyces meridianus]